MGTRSRTSRAGGRGWRAPKVGRCIGLARRAARTTRRMPVSSDAQEDAPAPQRCVAGPGERLAAKVCLPAGRARRTLVHCTRTACVQEAAACRGAACLGVACRAGSERGQVSSPSLAPTNQPACCAARLGEPSCRLGAMCAALLGSGRWCSPRRQARRQRLWSPAFAEAADRPFCVQLGVCWHPAAECRLAASCSRV